MRLASTAASRIICTVIFVDDGKGHVDLSAHEQANLDTDALRTRRGVEWN